MKIPNTDQLHILRKKIRQCYGAQRFGFQNRIRRLQKKPSQSALDKLSEEIEQSIAHRTQRIGKIPLPKYPEALPVSAKKEQIIKAFQTHQVTIICGETGSGKTTQLPKMCLDAGYGTDGFIGHTQPRRIAARSVSKRIAEELENQEAVGYKVRFNDKTHADNYIKLMTDGILLAEIQEDRYLNQYSVIIIDEAHERSLNIDFLLGYMKWLLKRRRDLKLIITSATIDAERFSKHYSDAPVINVSGRTYPVEIRYRPLTKDDSDQKDLDMQEAIADAVHELMREPLGDILIFLPGEREIRDTTETLTKEKLRGTEILPLFSRLSASEQNRIFQSHAGRRIILSTNVAETSLTVPGIKYVIDSGQARISRYSWRARIQRLPIEAVSQASANQRSGRCGRVSDGIAIRLYSEEDFQARKPYTEPEILRTNLASVILQMEAARLGEIENFPFLENPDSRLIRDGYKLLFEVHAVNEQHRLTKMGRELARLPIDPRLARMLIAAEKQGALTETLVIVSALSVQDPRERPLEKQQAADEKHSRFRDEDSDFIAYLNLWNHFHEQRKALSHNQLRKLCRKEFISYLRMREWIDIHRQIKESLKGMQFNSQPANFDAIHQSLITGLLSTIGCKDADKQYLGANNRKFYIFPGSGLKKKQPKWIASAEIVETSNVFARTVAKIQPQWIEHAAPHLIKHHYSEPHWEKKPANVAARERLSLYGLTIASDRKVNFGRIDPVLSREIFIRHALVYGEYDSKAPFFSHNRALIDDIENLEAKSRRRDLLVDENILYDFYDSIIPETLYNGHAFEKWRKQFESRNAKALFLTREHLLQRTTEHVDHVQYPDQWSYGDIKLPLLYHFEPGANDDGVSVKIPVVLLNQVTPEPFEYLIPGLLEDKITAMIRALPKAVRKNFVPAPEYAKACAQALSNCDRRNALLENLSTELHRMTGIHIPKEITEDNLALEDHLLMRFVIIDENGKTLRTGRYLPELQQTVKHTTTKRFAQLPTEKHERDGITEWDFDDLPEFIEISNHGLTLKTYPALVDKKDSVSIRLFDSPEKASTEHYKGLLRLIILNQQTQYRYLLKNLPGANKLCMQYTTIGQCNELKNEIVMTAFQNAYLPTVDHPNNSGNNVITIRSQQAFKTLSQQGEGEVVNQANQICHLLSPILEHHQAIGKRMKGSIPPTWIEALNDINSQLAHLIYKGFVKDYDMERLRHLPRYLKGIQKRLEKLNADPMKDRALRLQAAPYWEYYTTLLEQYKQQGSRVTEENRANLQTFRWMIEEFRISLFAQELGTDSPISAKRLDKMKKSL